jgi:hypothetical protein
MTRQTLAFLLAALCLSSAAQAETPAWVDKTTNAVEHGAQAAGNGIQRGMHAAGNGIATGYHATVRGIKRGAEATGNAFHKVGEKLSGEHSQSGTESAG